MTQQPLTGQCLCGSVKFRLSPPLREVVVCHCRQCARWTGLAVAATAVEINNFELLGGADELAWFASSSEAARGFCKRCGSSLFWKPNDGSRISVLAGSLEPPTRLKIGMHVFVADKSDFYEICDGAPQSAASGGDNVSAPRSEK
jgi:hypothetical protein